MDYFLDENKNVTDLATINTPTSCYDYQNVIDHYYVNKNFSEQCVYSGDLMLIKAHLDAASNCDFSKEERDEHFFRAECINNQMKTYESLAQERNEKTKKNYGKQIATEMLINAASFALRHFLR